MKFRTFIAIAKKTMDKENYYGAKANLEDLETSVERYNLWEEEIPGVKEAYENKIKIEQMNGEYIKGYHYEWFTPQLKIRDDVEYIIFYCKRRHNQRYDCRLWARGEGEPSDVDIFGRDPFDVFINGFNK